MDAVITYVDSTDPLWLEDYKKALNKPIQENRFRSWDTLRFWFRGLAKYAPFIEKVHLVVARDSQVPEWINRDEVHVVLHKDIIPEKYLPTFNSCAIEMFLPFIEGLSEEFIYFNDDMFLVNPVTPDLFFKDGRPQDNFRERPIEEPLNIYRHQCINSSQFARRAAGLKEGNTFFYPVHWCHPMLKSDCLELLKFDPDDVERRLSKLRTSENLNQYIFINYSYCLGHSDNHPLPNIYVSFAESFLNVLNAIIECPGKLLCINDNGAATFQYEGYKSMIYKRFQKRLPDYCKYEKEYKKS